MSLEWDVFISHAWEDKEAIAHPLAQALRQKGVRVWYDDFTLTLGDSLSQSINKGLGGSRYGIVILSPNFFAKQWPQMELNGLTAREAAAGKTILPIWHHVDRAAVLKYSPVLADKLAVSTDKGLDVVVQEVMEALALPAPTPVPRPTPVPPPPESLPPEPPRRPVPPPPHPAGDSSSQDLRRYWRPAAIIGGLLLALVVLVALLGSLDDEPPEDTHLARPEPTTPAPATAPTTPPPARPTPDAGLGATAVRAGNYAAAWKTYDDALTRNPGDQAARVAREDVAMRWLEDIRVTGENAKFSDIVDKVWPALSEGAETAQGARAADLVAHMGWGDFLRSRDGVGGLDPTAYYRRALELDPTNPYAHAMWGHWILWQRGSLTEAQTHFGNAIMSGRAREFVRNLQLSSLMLYPSDPALTQEAVRVANEMRGYGEAPPTEDESKRYWSRFWSIYYDRLLNGHDRDGLLSVLPAKDHLATFRWLFPDASVPAEKKMLQRFFLATLEEAAGERLDARASYQAVKAELDAKKLTGTLRDRSEEGIRRLQ